MTIPFLKNILTIDKKRALPILREWRHWLLNVDSNTVDYFNTIEEYILYRAMNIGIRPCGPTMRFVMELDVTEEEVELANPILWYVCATIALTNDYWSWHKEALHAGPEHQMKIMSGVVILMKEKKVEAPEALEMLKQLACEYEQKVVDMCAGIFSKYPCASKDFHAYIQGQLWLVAGNNY
ncbi:hypothetical protein PENVUL_c194G00614 [Penicillium vulpinum]|uniref:Terpene synthase metal-binding domain-containing protein n=2 Tax=Penicillium vulpinum TaxID=29845 RepID=A0A1V6QV97_9EURO|nr:hypothetical protein PENVUL_c194G00614 [Penicillium vulpinum]